MSVKTEISDQNKITSLQSLRALSFVGIFLCHAGCDFQWSLLAVSVFFVLSGFLLTYSYQKREMVVSLKNNFRFAISKIKKLYPLHLLTMSCAILLGFFFRPDFGNPIELIQKIVLNISLLQTWIPDTKINTSLNGVAWYLSVMLFLYFMFPYIKKWIRNMKNSTLGVICVCILITQIISCIPMIAVFGNASRVYIWFMYCFPVFRLGDFFVGCSLGKYFSEHSCSTDVPKNRYKWSLAESVLLVITLATIIRPFTCTGFILLDAVKNWTTLYIPIAAGWVYLFAVNKGIITRILNNRVFIYFGNISPYMFLIHHVITLNTPGFLEKCCLTVDGIGKVCIILIQLILTVVFTLIYMKCKKQTVKF